MSIRDDLREVDYMAQLGEGRSHTIDALDEVFAERDLQDAKWGEQNHPDRGGLGEDAMKRMDYLETSEMYHGLNDSRVQQGSLGWDTILLEEVFEALAEKDSAKLRGELIQVAAVAAAWIEAIDRRAA